jgi:hypothetical protein
MTAGCGGTSPDSPTEPSPVSPAPDFPSVAGEWINDSSLLVLQFRGADTSTGWSCNARLRVLAQTGGSFSGTGGMQGGSPESDRKCTSSFSFAGDMTRDGTLTSFRLDRALGVGSCAPVSDASFIGAVTSNAMRIQMNDRASCPDAFGALREYNRTLTISVKR